MIRLRLAALLLLGASSISAADTPVATILSYHEVLPGGVPRFKMYPRPGASDVESEEERYTIKREDFIAQLDYLDQNGYHVIPLTDLIDYIERRRTQLPQKAVVITVDDGYLSAYKEIFPIMRKRHIRFTLFIYPQIIGRGKNYVSWSEVTEMARQGVDIESHSFTHSFLTLRRNHDVKPEDYPPFLLHELLDSKIEIEKRVGKPVRCIAIPYSEVDETVRQAAHRYGYEAALYDRDAGELISQGTPLMHLIRFPVLHNTTLEQFKNELVR